jgi:hypothetical protein
MPAGPDPRFKVRFKNASPPYRNMDDGRPFTLSEEPFERAAD